MGLKTMFGSRESYKNSVYRETVTTYKFISELMIAMAKYDKVIDILRTTSGDLFGYDLIINCDNKVKLVQLKTTINTSQWEIKNSLLKDPNGEVIVIYLSFTSEDEWQLGYRILDKTRIPDLISLPDVGKYKIKDMMLEPERSIDQIAIYLFR